MKSDTRERKRAKDSDRYFALVREFPLRPIHSERGYSRAIAMLNSLIDRDGLTPDEMDYLEILGDIISVWERVHHPIPPLNDAELLKHLIEEKGVTQADVARETGIVLPTISNIIHGKRRISRSHMGKLAAYFGVEPGLFVQGDKEE